MALVERLMHDSSEPHERWIHVHDFFAACLEIITGNLTSAKVQNALAMTPADLVDWNAIVATIPAQNQTAARAIWVERMHAVFILAEERYTEYSTPAEVRTKLGI